MDHPRVAGDLRSVVYNTPDYHPHGVLLYSRMYSLHRFGCPSTSSLVADHRVYRRHTEHGYCLQGMVVTRCVTVCLFRLQRAGTHAERSKLAFSLKHTCLSQPPDFMSCKA